MWFLNTTAAGFKKTLSTVPEGDSVTPHSPKDNYVEFYEYGYAAIRTKSA